MTTRCPPLIFCTCIAVYALTVAGCGGSDAAVSQSDEAAVRELVIGMPDLATNTKLAKERFAESLPSPADMKKLARYTFEPDQPSIAGNSATVMVSVTDGERDLGKSEWSFVKGGEVWKIKAAPLPK